MRLLQLNPTGDEQEALDFHPLITVVTGLGESGRDRLRRAVAALPRGDDPGCPGLIESHGIFLDLDAEMLRLLDLQSDADVVVGAAELRKVAVAPPEQARAALATDEAALTGEQMLELTPEGANPAVDAARRAQRDARESLAILKEAAERARADLEEASGRRRRAQAALEVARDAGERPALELIGTDLGSADLGAEEARLRQRVDELEAELQRANRGIAELRGLDTRPIQVLLDAIRNPEPVEYVSSERAHELADEMDRLQAELAAMEDELEAQGRGPRTAMARLEEARAELADAERAMQKPELSPEQVAELEEAHEAVLAAESKASGGIGIGRRSAKKQLDEAMAREQEVLAQVGYPTWSAYVMGADLLGIDPLAQERVERARFDLEAAEAHWAQVSAEMQADPRHAAVLEQLESHYLEAVDLLGGEPEGDLQEELRELQVAKREVTTDELVDALAYQLELVGMSLGSSPGLDRTVMVADAFLAEAAGVTDRIAELEEERGRIEGELAVIEQQLRELAEKGAGAAVVDLTDAGGPPPGGGEPVDLDGLAGVLREAEEAEAEAAEMLEAREALLDAAIQIESVATGRLKKLAGELADAEMQRRAADPLAAFDGYAGATASTDDEFSDTAEVDAGREAVEFALLSRLAALRSFSYAGSVPLLLDEAFADLDGEEARGVLAKLDRLADAVQVIVMSNDPSTVAWAEEVGFARAAVVPSPAAFA